MKLDMQRRRHATSSSLTAWTRPVCRCSTWPTCSPPATRRPFAGRCARCWQCVHICGARAWRALQWTRRPWPCWLRRASPRRRPRRSTALTTLPTLSERFVIPQYHRETAVEAWKDPLAHKGETGFGYIQAPARGARWRRTHGQGLMMTRLRTPARATSSALPQHVRGAGRRLGLPGSGPARGAGARARPPARGTGAAAYPDFVRRSRCFRWGHGKSSTRARGPQPTCGALHGLPDLGDKLPARSVPGPAEPGPGRGGRSPGELPDHLAPVLRYLAVCSEPLTVLVEVLAPAVTASDGAPPKRRGQPVPGSLRAVQTLVPGS